MIVLSTKEEIAHFASQAEYMALNYAIGNFDGFHPGHLALIEAAHALGDFGIITLEPHPRQFFKPDLPPFRLMRAADKQDMAQHLGAKVYVKLPFDQALADMTPDEFHQQILAPLAMKTLFFGPDFRYGKMRSGDENSLIAAGFSVRSIAPLLDETQRVYSSSRIRQAINDGDFIAANAMLARPWQVSGVVEEGDKLGRTIGFPTANLRLGGLLRPPIGIYACWVRWTDETGQMHKMMGAAYYGNRPTIDGKDERFEVHLLDFDGNLYGQNLFVEIIARVRGDQNFASLKEMTAQIAIDCAAARLILENKPL